MNHETIYNYLKGYMTDERDQLFRNVIAERTRKLTVVIEDVYQPHNASAVLRSCDCFGVQDVHIIENDNKWEPSDGVSMGSQKWLSVSRYNEADHNTEQCLMDLKSKGYSIVATTPHENDFILKDLPINQKTALVFGSEMRGISDVVREHADAYVRIPMYGFTESFNISVAAALSLYELTHRIRKEQNDWQLSEPEVNEIIVEWALRSIREGEAILQRFIESNEHRT